MIKGTINIFDFYGKIESIESKNLTIGTNLVNKSTGAIFIIESVNVVLTGFYAKITMYSIKRKNGTYTRFIDYDLLRKYYWKVV